jgi:hypothetical protein
MAKNAMAIRYAVHAKKANERRIFNAKQARRNLERGIGKTDKNIERFLKLNEMFKGFKAKFIPKKKGG